MVSGPSYHRPARIAQARRLTGADRVAYRTAPNGDGRISGTDQFTSFTLVTWEGFQRPSLLLDVGRALGGAAGFRTLTILNGGYLDPFMVRD